MTGLLTPGTHRRSWLVPLNILVVILMSGIQIFNYHRSNLFWVICDLVVIVAALSYIFWGDRRPA